MRIVSVVGARPQFIKLKPIQDVFDRMGVEHTIIHTGQHYDQRMSETFFRGLELPDAAVNLAVGSGSQAEQTGSILIKIEPVLKELQPDWVVVYGDTNSTLSAALAAAKIGLPLAHIEAGLRSFNREMPEEINRVLTDHVSDVLFAPTELAMRNLANERLAERAHLVGDVMADLVRTASPKLDPDAVCQKLDLGRNFFVCTIHRASNTDNESQLRHLIEALSCLDFPIVLVAHPRLKAVAEQFGIHLAVGNIRVIEPVDYVSMLSLLVASRGLITDSGGLQKEAFLLGVVCTTLRKETEWPETLAGGMNVLDPEGDNLANLVSRNVSLPADQPFGDGRSAERIAALLLGA